MSALLQAVSMLDSARERAEDEYAYLAAPDGTVAVPFEALRVVLDGLRANWRAETSGLGGALPTAKQLEAGRRAIYAYTGLPNQEPHICDATALAHEVWEAMQRAA